MVTRSIVKRGTWAIPVVEIKLSVVRYLLPFTPANSYQTKCMGNSNFATTSENTSVIRYIPGNHTIFGFAELSLIPSVSKIHS